MLGQQCFRIPLRKRSSITSGTTRVPARQPKLNGINHRGRQPTVKARMPTAWRASFSPSGGSGHLLTAPTSLFWGPILLPQGESADASGPSGAMSMSIGKRTETRPKYDRGNQLVWIGHHADQRRPKSLAFAIGDFQIPEVMSECLLHSLDALVHPQSYSLAA